MNLELYGNENRKVGIIGLGFVGLPLAMLFAEKGFDVTGIDLDVNKIKLLESGRSYIAEISEEKLSTAFSSKRFQVTDNYDEILNLDVVIICVPTPVGKSGNPDLSFLTHATYELKSRLKKGQIVIIESSTYPGTTTEVVQPILEKNKFTAGKDFFLCYSPERIDPGNKAYQLNEIPKVVSGVTPQCLERINKLYTSVFNDVVKVASTKIAEMTKLLENTYRLVNISFINEMAMLCDCLQVDIWEVIDAASTKPYGFSPFYPGPGIGGHCIPVDPTYLSWKGKQHGFISKFIDLANNVNQNTPKYIINKTQEILLEKGISLENAKVLLCGISYKKQNGDIRESASVHIFETLKRIGTNISYHDPYVPELLVEKQAFHSIELITSNLEEFDCTLILTDHTTLPIQLMLDHSKTIFDCRNATHGYEGKADVVRFGGGSN